MRWSKTGNQRILLRARSGTGGELESEPYGFARGSPEKEVIQARCGTVTGNSEKRCKMIA